MEGVWVVPLVGCGWFLKSGGYSTRDLLGPSTILTKLSHTHGYINWLSLVKKYANNFNLMFYTRTKKEFSALLRFCKETEISNPFPLPIMPYVYPGFSRPHPWGKMFAREQYYDGNMVFFARCITEAHGTGTGTHPCVCKICWVMCLKG